MSDPPEPKRRVGKLPADVATKLENNQTVELETADFDELGQAGVIASQRNRAPVPADHATDAEPKVVVEAALEEIPPEQPETVELPKQDAPRGPDVQKDIRTQYVDRVSVDPVTVSEPKSGRAVVVTLYLVVAVVLAISIYYRFG